MKIALNKLIVSAALFVCFGVQAKVTPHQLFSDGVVLQQGREIPVWGTASDGERVTVEFAGQKASTKAANGRWIVKLKAVKAGGPFTMKISGENTVTIRNVLVGEVWICSGQSNMAFQLYRAENAQGDIDTAADPQLRFFRVPHEAADQPRTDVEGNWMESTPTTASNFSAVAFYFGRDLRKSLKVPVGLIDSSVGGTPAEAWTPKETLESNPELKAILEKHEKAVGAYKATAERVGKKGTKGKAAVDPAKSAKRPCGLYNAMIAPLQPFGIAGAIWYQGEANAGRAEEYKALFPAMIQSWRQAWKEGDFPFLFVQIAPHERMTPEIREAQLWVSQHTPLTGMAVTADVGNPTDIHPKQKAPVGARLALAARGLAYGERIEYSGPVFQSMRADGGRAVISFTHADSGLVAKGGELKGFEISGADNNFVPAKAVIEGSKVIASNPSVAEPKAVRYGWAKVPDVNLFNGAGLPASPFRTKE